MYTTNISSPAANCSLVGVKPFYYYYYTHATPKDSVTWRNKTTTNGSRILCIKTWNPIDNKKFETLSYLPPLSDDSIAKEIDYMLNNGWIPCLEFDKVEAGYYDGRYWTLWKLPMFGCNDASQVLSEIQECKLAYPDAYIRCLAFDNIKQVQCMAFVIQKPLPTATTASATPSPF